MPTISRPLRPLVDRVLIIGLDGATFDVLRPMMEEGRMQRLRELVACGVHGTLFSTVPPITPAAWTTFLTGKNPGAHGIIDFERYDPATHRLRFNSTISLSHVRNLWQILSDAGLRVGSINVPMTFPAIPVNGFLISGFETPSYDREFVYPPEFKAEILSRWPDPTLRAKWRHRTLRGQATFERNLDYVRRSFDQGVDMTRFAGDRFGWDVLMVVLKLVDNLQHKAWKYLDPRWSGRHRRRREQVRQVFADLDRAVGRLVDYADAHKAAVLIVSDHGHGSLEGKVQPNLLLHEWGYLALHAGGAQAETRAKYLWDRMLGRTGKFKRVSDIAHDLAVDFTRTRACIMHAGMAGFLYVNLKDRQPGGIVDPKDYEALRDELSGRFLGPECQVESPDGKRIALFEAVHKPEALYGCSRHDQPWMPDLMLIPHRSLAVVRKIRGRCPVHWLPYRRIEGTHRPEGILVAAGPGIVQGRTVQATLADCAPTLLAMLGLRIPDDMQGRVATEWFDTPPTIERESARLGLPTSTPSEVYSADELDKVTERLASLGYLE